ncbi:hypothetical protein [Streptomyces sp. NPDC097640]|uniref:hypothetical protein n=1 Tax=Streptomyces sp. NPDC097640 TaxID=3157229 RepID=UPI00332C8541
MLTAVVLTPARFPSVLGDDYPEACAAPGLEPYEPGYSLVLGQDGDGARWTIAVDDGSVVACAIAAWDCGMEYDLAIDERTVVVSLAGWPLAVAVRARGVPAPHGPGPMAEEPARPPLAPPNTERWGPARRRLGADEIALQWAQWREQVDSDVALVAPGEKPHGGVRRALEEARGYLDAPPPLGRVRSAFASGDARTLLADGPGWSIVARTDDIAFVLPVGRGPELPGLLTALDEVAGHPG